MSKIKSAVLAVAGTAFVGWTGYSFYEAYQPQPEIFQGQIEAQQYSISSKVPGRIEEVLVHKGQQIDKGQLIFTLYSPELDAKLEQAKAGQEALMPWQTKPIQVHVSRKSMRHATNGRKPKLPLS